MIVETDTLAMKIPTSNTSLFHGRFGAFRWHIELNELAFERLICGLGKVFSIDTEH